MKSAFLTLLILLFCIKAKSQEISEEELSEKATSSIEMYNAMYALGDKLGENEARITAYETLSVLVDKFPNSKDYPYYLFSKASMTFNGNEAKMYFNEIIRINKAYVRESYISLAFLAVEEKDFKKASMYLEEIDRLKPNYSCGTAYVEDLNKLKKLRELCNAGLKK
jgi:outer membrane protein assembly factor BamD (BamD/ComL family)